MNDKLYVMLKLSDLTPAQQDIMAGKLCPYCNSATKSVPQKEIYGQAYDKRMVICCVNYPACDSYVGTHDDGTALGRLAKQELRFAKKKAKEVFNRLWQCAYMSRNEAYAQLSEHLQLAPDLCHFGMFGKETCEKAGKWALEYLVEESKKPKPEFNTIKPGKKKTLYFIEKANLDLDPHIWHKIKDANDHTFAELKAKGMDVIGAFPTQELVEIWTKFYNGYFDKDQLNYQLQKLQK